MLTTTMYPTRTTSHNCVMPVTSFGEAFLDKIATRQAVVGVIGLGYVGLPLAAAFGQAGFRVVGIDVDAKKVASLNAGRSYIEDVPSEQIAALRANAPRLVLEPWQFGAPVSETLSGPGNGNGNGHGNGNGNGHGNGNGNGNGHGHGNGNGNGHGQSRPASDAGCLFATTEYSALAEVDAVIVCVPTPLNDTKDPDLTFIECAADQIALHLHPGMLVVLESTTYPGTTDELVLPRLQRAGLTVGEDFFLAFSPERIDPGRTDYTVTTTPKVIGGMTRPCLEAALALYSCAIERVVPVSSPKAAEMVKLLENTFRLVNIGLVNEMAIMCERLDLDVWEIIEAAKTKPYGYVPFYPGPGLGGHCIPIDPLYLSWKLKALNYNARFIQLASEVNAAMPEYVREKVVDALNEEGKALKGARVLVLGVAYKENISDLRESPALEVIHLLRAKGAEVVYHDPYVPSLRMGGEVMTSTPLDERALQAADCVVVTTAHKSYDWVWIAAHSRLIVDSRNALRGVPAGTARVVKL